MKTAKFFHLLLVDNACARFQYTIITIHHGETLTKDDIASPQCPLSTK